jgi:riboflavin transporter FmnP
MATSTELLATELPAGLLALAWTMALFLAFVGTTSKCLPTNISAADVGEPARLVFQHVLAAETSFRGKKRTLRAALIVAVAVVTHLWMATSLGSLAGKAARRWCCATR